MTLIHYASSGGHHDITSACGVNGFFWPLETDPPGTGGADDNEERRILFCNDGHEDLVTCPACKVEADKTIARRKQYDADVEAAGGLDAYNAALMQRLRARLAKKAN